MATQNQQPRHQQARQTSTAQVPATITPRIPYAPDAASRFGIGEAEWHALTDAVWPSARTVEGVLLALSYCKARNLDPFKRPVHIVPIWSKEKRKSVESVWPGINELRTTATRTNAYAGRDECEFGPNVEMTFTGEFENDDGTKRTREVTLTFPEWARYTVYRLVQGQRVPFQGPQVYWLETYATIGRTDLPNEMWEGRPRGQLDKCAEAAALRAAFPEEIGAEYIADEMAHASLRTMRDITPAKPEAEAPPKPKREDFHGDLFDVIGSNGEIVTRVNAISYVDHLSRMMRQAAASGDDFHSIWSRNFEEITRLPDKGEMVQRVFDKLSAAEDAANEAKKQNAATPAAQPAGTAAGSEPEATTQAQEAPGDDKREASSDPAADNAKPAEPAQLVYLTKHAKPDSMKQWARDMLAVVPKADPAAVSEWYDAHRPRLVELEKYDAELGKRLDRACLDRIASV